MKTDDLLTMCWRLVLRNRRRYKAVMAGIALGTAGFIIIQTMGDSVERKLGDHLELLGEATVIRARWDNVENYHPGEYTWDDVDMLRNIPDVKATAPIVNQYLVPVQAGNMSWNAGLAGVDQEYWRTQTPHAAKGRLLGPSDVVGRKRVCVLGKDAVKYLFNNTDPTGKSIKLLNENFEVVGALGGIQHGIIRRRIFIPITTAQSLFRGMNRINVVFMRVGDWNRVGPVRDQAMALLKARHKGYEDGIRVVHYPKRIEKVRGTVDLVKLFIYASLVATVLLGGLGITNVMLAAVQDRTREIGLRKALGAKQGVILLQFLTESVFISFFAGGAGVIIGSLGVQVLKGVLDVEVSGFVMISSISVGLAFTAFLGIASGLYPSVKASRMDSVSAMRFE